MASLRKLLLILIGLGFVAWSFSIVLKEPAPAKYQLARAEPALMVNGKRLFIERAETPEARERGLSGRDSLPEGSGMLFIFDEPGMYGFWMKEMRFAIDIVWLDESLRVVDIARSVSPNSFPQVFYPPRPVKYVLETNPGEL